MSKLLLACGNVVLLTLLFAQVSVAEALEDPLATLRTNHPRVMVVDDRIQELQNLVKVDPQARQMLEQLNVPCGSDVESTTG